MRLLKYSLQLWWGMFGLRQKGGGEGAGRGDKSVLIREGVKRSVIGREGPVKCYREAGASQVL